MLVARYTIADVAQETGIPASQIYEAIRRGDLVVPAVKAGERKTLSLTGEQVQMVEQTIPLVELGVAFYMALRILNAGWRHDSK